MVSVSLAGHGSLRLSSIAELRPHISRCTRNEELPAGRYFALLVTYLLVTRPFHNLPTGKRAHNLLQHARAGNQ
jgi:hypothetical protein